MSTETAPARGASAAAPAETSGGAPAPSSPPPPASQSAAAANASSSSAKKTPDDNSSNQQQPSSAAGDAQSSTRRVTIGGASNNNDNGNPEGDAAATAAPATTAEEGKQPAVPAGGGTQEQQQQQQQMTPQQQQAQGQGQQPQQQQGQGQQANANSMMNLPQGGGPSAAAAAMMMQQQQQPPPPQAAFGGAGDPFLRRGSMASFGGGMEDFFSRRGSLGFDMGMDAFFGGGPRRDSMDSTTAALDQAIMDLSRRRYSSAMGSLPPDAMLGGPGGAGYGAGGGGPVGMGGNMMGTPAAGAAASSNANAPGGASASQAGSQTSHESITARQQQLQQQQRELEQRQKELELERQKLIQSMQERSYGSGAGGMDNSSRTMSLGLGSVGSGSNYNNPHHPHQQPPPPPQSNMPMSQSSRGGGGHQQNWWICQICNSKAFASHEEAMAHENLCEQAASQRGIRGMSGCGGGGSNDPMHPLPMQTDLMMGGPMGRNFSMGLGGLMDTSVRGMSMGLGTMDNSNSTRGIVSMGMDSSRGGSVGFDSSRNLSLGMDSSMSSSTYPNERTMSMGPFAMLQHPIPLAMDADKDWLTPLHCFVRRHCVEVFTASESDVATPSKGKRKPIQVGQIGIRCPHCHTLDADGNDKARERGSVYYPTTISSIYNATMNLLQRHLHNCPAVPDDIMRRYETLKADDARSGTSKRYWIESALSLGLVDTPNGIRHSALRPPPLPSLTRQQESTGQSAARRNSNEFFSTKSNAMAEMKDQSMNSSMGGGGGDPLDQSGRSAASFPDQQQQQLNDESIGRGGEDGSHRDDMVPLAEREMTDSAPLVTVEDKPYATTFSYHLLSQMQPCVFTEADRLGKRKGLPPGFPGLACRHCFGGYGSGRFFPSSIKTLSDTSKTLNVLHNHMMRCRKCPAEVKESLEKLRATHDEERAKMKFGSQKAFFARIWEQLHGKDHPGSFKRAATAKRSPSGGGGSGSSRQQQQQMMMMQQQQQQQQQQSYYSPQQQHQHHPGFSPSMPKGNLDVLAAASSPSKRRKLG